MCRAYLLHARVVLAMFKLDEVEKWLYRCLQTAEKASLSRYQNIANKEIEVFLKHKQRILDFLVSDIPLSPQEQEQRVVEYVEYIKNLISLEEEELR